MNIKSYPFRELNANRIGNIFRNYSSYQFAKYSKKTTHPGAPISISIEPTTSCNLRCPHCPSGLRSFTRDTGMLSEEVNNLILDQIGNDLLYITYYFQGEPFLNPGFLDLVKAAHRKKIFTATSTNAHYLDRDTCERIHDSGLNKLIISIDGTTQETYGKYRIGGKLEKVLDGTKNLVSTKKKSKKSGPWIIWQFIVFEHNQHELPHIKKLAIDYRVDELQIKTAQFYDFEHSEGWIPEDKKLSRYEKKGNQFVIKNKLLNECWRMWNSAVVTWDGDVVPCCFDKDAKHSMGNVKATDFKAIWNGSAYKDFRTKLFAGRSNIDICTNCSEGTKTWV